MCVYVHAFVQKKMQFLWPSLVMELVSYISSSGSMSIGVGGYASTQILFPDIFRNIKEDKFVIGILKKDCGVSMLTFSYGFSVVFLAFFNYLTPIDRTFFNSTISCFCDVSIFLLPNSYFLINDTFLVWLCSNVCQVAWLQFLTPQPWFYLTIWIMSTWYMCQQQKKSQQDKEMKEGI